VVATFADGTYVSRTLFLLRAAGEQEDFRPFCRWQLKNGPFWRRWRRGCPQPSRMSLSLLLGTVVQNGPERSRARRCWVRRSGPLTARTVLRDWSKRERLGEELAKDGAKQWPLRPAPLTSVSRYGGRAHAGLFRRPKSSCFGTGFFPVGYNFSPVRQRTHQGCFLRDSREGSFFHGASAS